MNKTGCTASIKCVKIEHSQFHSILILTMVTIVVFTDRPLVPMQCGCCGNCLASGCETSLAQWAGWEDGEKRGLQAVAGARKEGCGVAISVTVLKLSSLPPLCPLCPVRHNAFYSNYHFLHHIFTAISCQLLTVSVKYNDESLLLFISFYGLDPNTSEEQGHLQGLTLLNILCGIERHRRI